VATDILESGVKDAAMPSGHISQPRMMIYLDTMLWNELCDQKVDAAALPSALAAQGKVLVLGAEAIYEMAKTFQSNPTRGKELFTYLKKFTDLGIPGVKDNPMLLVAEADSAMSGTSVQVDVFWEPVNDARMRQEIEKLSNGIVDNKAASLIESRRQLAASERAGISSQYGGTSALKARLSRVAATDLNKWITREAKRSGRFILKQHLAKLLPGGQPRQIAIAAKRLLASQRFRLSHAVVRADLYSNWRAANTGSMPRDLLPDLDHIVTASYFDVYATKEAAQVKYAPLVLGKTRIAIYDGKLPISKWLESL
jgi:hypothetical protein